MPRGDGSLYKQKGSANYWMQFFLNGRKHRESTGETDEKRARDVLRKRLKQVHASEVTGAVFESVRMRKLSVSNLCDALESDLALRGKWSPQNRSHLKRARADFGQFLALAITPGVIDHYIEDRRADKFGKNGELIPGDRPASINRTLQLLGQAFHLAIKHGTLSRAPYIRKLSEADNVRQGFFSETQIQEILANLPDDGLRDFVEWAACTGQRKGEIASLTWDMLDGDEVRIPGELCKNRRPRVIPLGPELTEIIERRRRARAVTEDGAVQLRLADLVFHRGDGKPIGDFKKSWATATKKAHCEGKIFHDFRRTCARRLLAAGVPQVVARELTGHRTSAMFDRYAIICSAEVLAAQKRVSEFRKQA
jgi:integrase